MKRKLLFYFIPLFLLGALILTYSNHFNNEFHFDDSHAILENVYIRSLNNWSLFFTDGTTSSSLPANQFYRPLLSLSFAFDYWLGDGLKPFYFHLSTFFWYVVQLVFMFFLFKKIFDISLPHRWNIYLTYFAIGWYGLHTANAETINYVCARSDSYSTLFVVIALVLYIYSEISRKYFLYFIPVIIACLIKEAAFIFPGLLFIYILLFEKKVALNRPFQKDNFNGIIKSFFLTIPVLILCVGIYIFYEAMKSPAWTPGIISRYNYIITQPFVLLHYFRTFFLPTSLSADTDWKPLDTPWDYRFIGGMIFIITLLLIAFWTSKSEKTRPVAFGIFWFFIALIPSSGVVPFSEVMNDHRMFYPFVGLMCSVVWTFALIIYKYEEKIISHPKIKYGLITVCLIILFSYAYGTTQRNRVWRTGESLWYDVTIKSPKNGRGLMNYGLTQMRQGKYERALEYFEKALEYTPYYSNLHCNLGIVKNALGRTQEAEESFKKAIQYATTEHAIHYFYGNFLKQHHRLNEAINCYNKSLQFSPAFMDSRYTLMEIYADLGEWDKLKRLVDETLKYAPNDQRTLFYIDVAKEKKSKIAREEEFVKKNPSAANYINLSLLYYNNRLYEKCIEACNKALELDKNNATAYNNMCISYLYLGKFDEAIKACEKCLQIEPTHQLGRGNLNWAKNLKAQTQSLIANPTPENYLNLSLIYYNNKLYERCIDICYEALKLRPNFAEAYNNICAAYNNLGKWEEAATACDKALQIKPDYELAKNNLKWARENIIPK